MDPSPTSKVVLKVTTRLKKLRSKERAAKNFWVVIYRKFLPSKPSQSPGENSTVQWVRHDKLPFLPQRDQAFLLPPRNVPKKPNEDHHDSVTRQNRRIRKFSTSLTIPVLNQSKLLSQ